MPRRQAHRDPVTPEVRARVLLRDGSCVAPRLGATTPCLDVWGGPILRGDFTHLQVDHVQKDYGRTGKRADSVPERLATVCPYHHATWATANRPALRDYLARVSGPSRAFLVAGMGLHAPGDEQ